MRLVLSEDGYALSLKSEGVEMLKKGVREPFCKIVQYRPYDNENFLMYPAKPMDFPSNRISREGDFLVVRFEKTYDVAYLKMDIRDSYISFTLDHIDYDLPDFGVKRKTEIDEFALVQLPVKDRKHFGSWLNVVWDNKAAVCLMGAGPQTRIDSYSHKGWKTMYAGAQSKVSLLGTAAVLTAAKDPDKLLDNIDRIEQDFGMPRGVQSRRGEQYPYSYYECRALTPQNVDRHIAYAKQGGFRHMVIYYTDFAYTCGHFLWTEAYPNGIEDLKAVVAKMKAAGMEVGFHIHYSKVSTDDPYVCNGHPDPRINAVSNFVLAEDLDSSSKTVVVEGPASNLRTEDGRRLLMIGDEIISYESVVSGAQSRFEGCERGLFDSTVGSYPRGSRLIQPDVDDWPRFFRVDQNSTIQDEIAQRLADIYDTCGFSFIYFDGAEDVPEPYWYNVSKAQIAVWSKLRSPMLFAEGALKSHYGWHLLSRGNAFDHFKPEKIHQAFAKYNIPCAEMIGNDFTSVDFGWLYCDMTPDIYEYVCSVAAAHNCPISFIAELDKLDNCPDTAENLAIIRKWESRKSEK